MKLTATFPKRRDGTYGSVTVIDDDGKRTEYKIDANGTVEIPDEHALVVLSAGNFTSPDAPAGNSGKKPDNNPETMLITNGDQTIDLMTLNQTELHDLCRELDLKFDARTGEKKLRDAIVAHVTGE